MLEGLTLGVSICRLPALTPDEHDGLSVEISNTGDESIDGLNVSWSYHEPYISQYGTLRHRTRMLGFTYETDRLLAGQTGGFLLDGPQLQEILGVVSVASPDDYQLIIASDDFEESVDSQQFGQWLEAEFRDE